MRILGQEYLAENGYFNIFFFQEKETDDFHAHVFYEIKYIISGTGYHTVLSGKREKVGPGDVIFIDKGTSHSIMSDNSSDRIINFNILFSDDFVFAGDGAAFGTDFVREMKKEGIVTVYDDKLRLRRIINDMHEEFNRKKDGYLDLLSLYTREVIFLMLRANHEKGHTVKNRYITAALTYIEENLDREMTVGEVARNVHLSANYLSKLFKQEMGKSPIEYIQGAKIQKVCELLTTTDQTFSECAYAVGYQNESYLRRVFKETTGQTPREYKKKSQGVMLISDKNILEKR